METDGGRGENVREQLREIERAEMAPWVVYPPTPHWWAAGLGVWAAVLALVIGLLDGVAQSLLQLGLVSALFLLLGWDRRRRGTWPSGRPPQEFRWAVLRMLLGAAAVGGVAWLVGEQVSVLAAAAVAGFGSWAVVARHERRYAAIAAGIRERLG